MNNLIKEKLPNNLIEKIINNYGEEKAEEIFKGYLVKRKTSLRINTLKSNIEEIKKVLNENRIEYKEVLFYDSALIIDSDIDNSVIEDMDIYKDGKIYLQNLSSMIPPLVLEPKEKQDILDMTAAPGGKTTEIAILVSNQAFITAIEANKIRAERLKYNIEKQGAKAIVLEKDARNLDDFLKFDLILLDAPCSGTGTYELDEKSNPILYKEEFAKKLEKTQTALLDKAIKLLKKNETMVYSTCSILKEENENIISKFIQKGLVEIVKFDIEKFKDLTFLPSKIDGVITIAPNENYEGFFVAKIRKK